MRNAVSAPLLLLVCFVANGFSTAGSAQEPAGQYVIDGLPLGGTVNREGKVYKEYKCSTSTQFIGHTYCARRNVEKRPNGTVTVTTSIIHDEVGTVAYVNRFIEPAFLSLKEVEEEIARLSAKYSQSSTTLQAPIIAGAPEARIARWGSLQLQQISGQDLAIVKEGRSPGKGILVDYLGDFTRSASLDFPVFSVEGNSGFVWAASFDQLGRGTLRFFAIDAAKLSKTRGSVSADSKPNTVVQPTVTDRVKAAENERDTFFASTEKKLVEQLLEDCGESCADVPEIEKLRQDTDKKIDQEQRAADEAARYAGAVSDEVALRAYVSTCSVCEFRSQAETEISKLGRRDKQAEQNEAIEYAAAKDNIAALKRYVADCEICEFASAAVDQIKDVSDRFEATLFEFKVCNNDPLPVNVAVAGREDAFSDLWMVKGSWSVDPQSCQAIGKFAKGYFYATAKNRRANWAGNEEKAFCMEQDDFSHLQISEYECSGSEALTKFNEFNINDSSYTWTLGAKPWSFAAVAYSPSSAAWGWAFDYSSRNEAERRALDECGNNATDCRVGSSARDDLCFTLAEGETSNGGKALGWAKGINRSEARQSAVQSCRQYGSGCLPVKETCSR